MKLFTHLLVISIASHASVVYGATRTASSSGDFNQTATWGGSSVPVNGDDIVINSGVTVTLVADFTTTGTADINGNLELNGFDVTVGGFVNTSTTGLIFNDNSGTTSTLTAGSNNTSCTYAGRLNDSSGTVALTKVGTKTLTLESVSTMTGVTTISGGTNSTCTQDCNGDWDGSASIDNCNVCSGGNTGVTPNTSCAKDCNNIWGGSASIDQCGICSGGTTGLTPNASCKDCNNEINGTAYIDDCNECVAGSTGKTPCGDDCAGVPGGTASIDQCGVCSGGTTGKTPNATCRDCNNTINGSATIDACNVCSGGTTGKTPNATCADCIGTPNGTAYMDNCNTCVGGTTGASACVQDCNGDWGGLAVIDACDECTVTPETDVSKCITSIGKNNHDEILIVPNPFTQGFNVKVPDHEMSTVVIMSVDGKVIFQTFEYMGGILGADLTAGVYVIKVVQQQRVVIKHIIKR